MIPFAITLALLLLMMSTSWFRKHWGVAKPEVLGVPSVKEWSNGENEVALGGFLVEYGSG